LKYKLSTKFHRSLFLFYFFIIFSILFSISPVQTWSKIIEFFVVFYWKGWRFYQWFQENSKSSFKKNINMWKNYVFQNSTIYYLFFYFLLFLTFYFQFRLAVLVNKFYKFLRFFILWIREFIKEFWKIMEYFSKKYRHFKSKILHKFIVYYLFFFFQHFGDLFFPISPIQTCQKILNIF